MKSHSAGRFLLDRILPSHTCVKGINGINIVENVSNYFITTGVVNNIDSQKVTNTNLSYRFGADWQVTPDMLVYGFYGRGYKGPGFTNAAPARDADLAVAPEISNGGEIGINGRLFNRLITYGVAAFYTTFNDLQSDPTPLCCRRTR